MKNEFPNFRYWANGSKKDIEVANSLFGLGYYPQCLFFCHLSLEKLLKAIIVKKTKNYSPYIHDLRRLAEIVGLEITLEQKKTLDKISAFNIAGRYADEKFEF